MQRYKVFVNEHSISFRDAIYFKADANSKSQLIEPSLPILSKTVDELLASRGEEDVEVFGSDIEKLWKDFKAEFQIVEAAGGLVINELGQVLCIYRLGKWDLPKGKMELGESREESAMREVEEECGLEELKLGKQLETTYHVYTQSGRKILKPTHWFKMQANSMQKLNPQQEEAIEKVEWFPVKNLSKVIENTYASLRPMLKSMID